MAGKKLTDAYVKTLTCEGKPYTVTDAGGGLSLYVSKTAKVWRYRYRYAGNAPVSISLGQFPDLDYHGAKEKLEGLDKVRRQGRDPRLSVHDPKESPTLADVLDYHLSKLSGDTKRTATSCYKDLREAHGKTRLTDFSRRVFKDWVEKNYGHRKGAAKALLRYLTSAFNQSMDSLSDIAIPKGFENPAAKLAGKLDILKDHQTGSYSATFEPDDVKKLFKGIEAAYADPEIWSQGVMVLELLLLTGARPTEIATLRKSEIVDCKTHSVIIKDRHKTWKKTGKPREIFLMPGAMKVIERAMASKAFQGDYLFPQRRVQANKKRDHIHQVGSYAAKVSKHGGVKFIPYNLRSGFINFALDHLGFEKLEVVAENVGHTDTRTTLTYYRKQRDSIRLDAAKKVDKAFAAVRRQAA